MKMKQTKVIFLGLLLTLIFVVALVGCGSKPAPTPVSSSDMPNEVKVEIYIEGKLSEAIFVTNRDSNRITVIDPRTNEIAATIPVNSAPYGIIADPQGKYVYVSRAIPSGIAVIDTTTYEIVHNIQTGHVPAFMDITADGRYLYVGSLNGTSVSVIDLQARSTVKTLPTGADPWQVKLNETERLLYSLNFYDSTMTVYDLEKDEVKATWDTPEGPGGLVIMPGGERAYVGVRSPHDPRACEELVALAKLDELEEIWYFDLQKGVPLEVIKMGVIPSIFALTPDGRYLYGLSHAQNKLYVLDTKTNQEIGSVVVNGSGIKFRDIMLTPDGKSVYIANSLTNTVSVVDTDSLAEIKQIEVPEGPAGIAFVKIDI